MDQWFALLHQLVDDGAEMTLIDRPECHTYFVSTYPERSAEMVEQQPSTVLAHDDLSPYRIGVLDRCVTISCYEQGSGPVHAVIDTDAPAIREWATSVYDTYRAAARRFTVPRSVG